MGTKIKKWMFPAAFAAVISTAAAVSAQTNQTKIDTAYVPLAVTNVDAATIKVYNRSVLMLQKTVAKNAETTLAIPLEVPIGGSPTGVLGGAQGRLNAPAAVSVRNGKVALSLSAQSYKNAEISLYAVNGKRALRVRASATEASAGISGRDLTAGVYLLSVKGKDGGSFASRITHRGGNMDISVAFLNEAVSPSKTLAKESAMAKVAEWSVTASAPGYIDSAYAFTPVKGNGNAKHTITLKSPTSTPKQDFKETVGGVTFDMIYIPGGTFTLGCEKSSGCPADAAPVSGVTVSDYFIGKAEVTTGLWKAVMGDKSVDCPYCQNSSAYGSMTWYEALEFACKLSQMTGRRYRMMTEAEFEYAAKKYASKLSNLGGGNGVSGEEWAYNSWNSKHEGGTDPVGPGSGTHTQKTRRDVNGTADNVTGRLIRSIEGIGPSLRLVISADKDYPPGMVPTCDIHAPDMGEEPENSYRDMRWVTGSDACWKPNGTISIGNFELRAWEDGTARLCSGYSYNMQTGTVGCKEETGQWFTSNNIAFVFVPSSGSIKKYAYIFEDITQASMISDNDFASGGGYIGRVGKDKASSVAKPTVSNLKSGAELAAAAGDNFKMVDMVNIPAAAKKQDSRLLDEAKADDAKKGWFQDNTSAGGVHHYRKDVDPGEFRFTVNQGNGRTMLANGEWFTVNNTFLRVTNKKDPSKPYTCDYLYAVTNAGTDSVTFYHNSFQGYERGDFRMFKKFTNAAWPTTTCGDICKEEIPKNLDASYYSTVANGKSTFKPAPCPAGGCK